VTSAFNIGPEPFAYDPRGLSEGFEYEQAAPRTPVRARILWPALGFPAVIAP